MPSYNFTIWVRDDDVNKFLALKGVLRADIKKLIRKRLDAKSY